MVRGGRAAAGGRRDPRWAWLLRAPEVPDPVKDLITGRASLVIVMVFAVVLGPIYEELFFRGFLFPLLAKTFGAAAGIFLSALPFALLHGAQNQWAWQQITLVGLAGSAFGFVRYRTGSTAASTILHSVLQRDPVRGVPGAARPLTGTVAQP